FLQLDQFVTSTKDNSALHSLVKQLYHVAIATKEPAEFLNSMKDQYINEDKLQNILDDYRNILKRKLTKLDENLYTLKTEYAHAERNEELKEKAIVDAYEKLAVMHKYVVQALDRKSVV